MENLNFEIRNTKPEDYDDILAIYRRARAFMREHGNPRQWGDHWPPDDVVKNDIEVGLNRVCVRKTDGKILGVFVYIEGSDVDPTYRMIEDGEWLTPNESVYGAVHRLAVSGDEPGTGTFCLNWAYEQCHHLRVDTHGDNTVMQGLLEKLGFTRCGIIYVEEDNDPRFAYEKL